MDGFSQAKSFIDAFEREIDHENSVFLDDAEQQKQTDHAVKRQCRSKNPKREQAAHNCGNNRRKQHRDRMHVAFVKNSQDHVHDEDGRDQENGD